MTALFDSLTLRGVTLRNRIGISPMCQYWAGNDGKPTDWHLVHLGSRAVGGAGLVMTEVAAIEARGRIGVRDVGIWSDDHIEPWARITRFLKDYGAVPGIQIGHAGRKASVIPAWDPQRAVQNAPVGEGGWDDIVAPSPIALRASGRVPRELGADDIAALVRRHRDAAVRADAAGFEHIEIHGGHGYLHASFLSPFSNKRSDRYGGSFDNRIRFLLESIAAIREVWPDRKPLAVRLSSTEWIPEGWQLEDTVALARVLKDHGVDLIDCSSGLGAVGGGLPPHPIAPGWQVRFAERVRREAGIPTAAVGMIYQPFQADSIIRDGRADLVLIATASLRDPYWPLNAAQALGPYAGEGVKAPTPYHYVVSRREGHQPRR